MPDDLNVRTPLFGRLTGGERTLDRQGLRDSVRGELELLFNTRSSFPSRRVPGAPLTVIDYGIPPLTDYAARNSDHQTELAAALRTAIEAFEPRLASVRVLVIPPEEDTIALTVTIQADLVIDSVREPVSFVVGADLQQGTWTIDAGH
jgi:type VI secretion system lysozyme-like protein